MKLQQSGLPWKLKESTISDKIHAPSRRPNVLQKQFEVIYSGHTPSSHFQLAVCGRLHRWSNPRSHKTPVGLLVFKSIAKFLSACSTISNYSLLASLQVFISSVVHLSNLGLVRLGWSHNISLLSSNDRVVIFVWRQNWGLMLGCNRCFTIQCRAPVCSPRNLAHKQLLCFVAV